MVTHPAHRASVTGQALDLPPGVHQPGLALSQDQAPRGRGLHLLDLPEGDVEDATVPVQIPQLQGAVGARHTEALAVGGLFGQPCCGGQGRGPLPWWRLDRAACLAWAAPADMAQDPRRPGEQGHDAPVRRPFVCAPEPDRGVIPGAGQEGAIGRGGHRIHLRVMSHQAPDLAHAQGDDAHPPVRPGHGHLLPRPEQADLVGSSGPLLQDPVRPTAEVPEPHRPVAAGADQPRSITEKSDAVDRPLMPLKRGQCLSMGHAPDPHGSVPGGGGQAAAIRAEGEVLDPVLVSPVPLDHHNQSLVVDIPQAHRRVAAARGEELSIGAKPHRLHLAGHPAQDPAPAPPGELPQAHHVVISHRGDLATVRAEDDHPHSGGVAIQDHDLPP